MIKGSTFCYFLSAKTYTVEVFTGDIKGGGTDANVFISIFGDKGDSGERALRNSETNRDKFERNKVSLVLIMGRTNNHDMLVFFQVKHV